MEKDYLEKKWLADNLTAAEAKAFDAMEDAEFNKKIVEGAQQFKASQFSRLKDFDVLKVQLEQKRVPVVQLNTYKVLFRIAALFVISLGIYFTFFYTSVTTIQTYASQKTNITLPDASLVELNASSSIAYNEKEWIDKREVQLEGEAFFKVAKGSKFDVITSEGMVSVLGTQFNVKSRKNYFEIECFGGLVSVKYKGEIIKLPKGRSVRFLFGNVVKDKIVNSKPDWLTQKSQFKSIPLYLVLDELERQYNITINKENIDVQRLFTGGFVHTDLEQALKAVTLPFNLTYKKDNSNHIIIYNIE